MNLYFCPSTFVDTECDAPCGRIKDSLHSGKHVARTFRYKMLRNEIKNASICEDCLLRFVFTERIHLVTCLFNDAVSRWGYIASNDTTMNWKWCGGKPSWSHLRKHTSPEFAWRDWWKPRQACQDCQSLGCDFNTRLSEYETRGLTTRPRHSVMKSRVRRNANNKVRRVLEKIMSFCLQVE